MPPTFLQELILIIASAFIGGFIARLLFLPPVLGYIGSGILFGILGTSLFPSKDILLQFSEIGISLLLFTLGFELSIDALLKLNKNIIFASIFQVIITTIFIIPLFLFLKLSLPVAFLFSILLSFSSTAVVIKLLQEKGLMHDFPGTVVFVLLFIQDLFVVPIIYFLPLLFSSETITAADASMFFISLLKSLGVFALLFLVTKFLLPYITNIIFRYSSHEFSLLATIFMAAISIYAFTSVGIPQTIAAFLAGVLISEQGKNLAPLSEVRPLRDLFLVLFFVMTGMLVNIQYVLSHLPLIGGLSILILLIKFLVIYLLLRIGKFLPSAAVFVSVYATNIGEFAAVISQIAYTKKVITADEYNLILSLFIVSLLLVPFWTRTFKKIAESIGNKFILKHIVGFGSPMVNPQSALLKDHVVLCGHGRVGSQIRSLLEFANIPYVVVDFNKKIVSELHSQNKVALYGDPSDHEVLDYAQIETAKALVLAVPDFESQKRIIQATLRKNPKTIIITRSHDEKNNFALVNLGVNAIVIPEFEAGIKIGRELLHAFEIDPSSISSFVTKLRKTHVN